MRRLIEMQETLLPKRAALYARVSSEEQKERPH